MCGGGRDDFCPKTLRARNGSVPSVGSGFREGHKFASGWIGSAPFRNLEKVVPWVSPCLIKIVCSASIIDRDRKVCISRCKSGLSLCGFIANGGEILP